MFDKIGRGLVIFSRNFLLIAGISLVSVVPMYFLGFLHSFADTGILIVLVFLCSMVLMVLLPSLTQAALVWALDELHEQREPGFRSAFAHGIRRWWPLFMSSILVGLAIMG